MPVPSPEILALVAGTFVLLTLAIGIIGIIVLQQKKLNAVQQKNLEELGDSEDRYRRLVKHSPYPMAVFVEDKVVYINDVGAKLLGAENPEAFLERPITDFLNQSFFESFKSQIKHHLQERKEIAVIEDRLVLVTGQVIDIEATAIPIIYDKKEAVQVVVNDITQRKRHEAELIAAKERAEQSDKLKDAFIANISHEIRTPLNVILGYSRLIMSEFTERIRPDELAFFESIERGGQRLMRTVEHILNISSIQVGTFELIPERIDVCARVEKLIQDLHSFADEKELTLEIIKEAPGAAIIADRYCFDQALTNLIDNAIKFTNEGSVSVRIYNQDHRIFIEVKDTGIGISAEYLPKVYNVFSQEVSGYTRPFEGLGLGLALTKRYVEKNEGNITVKSRKGQGTTFTLRFLSAEYSIGYQETPMPPEKVERQYPIIPDSPMKEGARTVLIVEDDPQTQEYMRVLLSKQYNVKLAASAKDAWNILSSHSIDLILMDLSLRGNEDGLQLTKRIRQVESFCAIPIIVITAHAFPEDRARSLEAGCDMYFAKPFQINELMTSMKELLTQHSLSDI